MMKNRLFLNMIGIFFVFFIWHVISVLELVNPLLLPSPIKIIDVLLEWDHSRELLIDGAHTFGKAIFGFLIGGIIGVAGGIVLGSIRILYSLFEFVIEFFRSLPAAALLPPFILFFGIGNLSQILLVVFACSLVVIVNTAAGVKNLNPTRTMVAHIMGASKFQIFYKVVLPEALPAVATGLRISISLALIVTIIAEMIISTDRGLGRTIIDTQMVFNTTEMYAAILLAGILGFIANKAISIISEKLIHWEGK